MRRFGLPEDWVPVTAIKVAGNPNAKPRQADPEMKTWTRVAVFEIHPVLNYMVGFRAHDESIEMSSRRLCSRFVALRLGPEDVTFLFQAEDRRQRVNASLHKITHVDDPMFRDTPLL